MTGLSADAADRTTRLPGLWLLLSAMLAVLGMAHHPLGHGTGAAFLHSIAAVGALARGVHGLLIALLLLQTGCLLELSRGLRRAAARLAFVCWSAGAIAMIAAAVLSGFVAPALAERMVDDAALADGLALQAFAHQLNQAAAEVGLALWLPAIAAWSLCLWRRGDRMLRLVAGYGLLAAAFAALGLVSGALRLELHGMQGVMLALAIWQGGLGALWYAGRIAFTSAPRPIG